MARYIGNWTNAEWEAISHVIHATDYLNNRAYDNTGSPSLNLELWHARLAAVRILNDARHQIGRAS